MYLACTGWVLSILPSCSVSLKDFACVCFTSELSDKSQAKHGDIIQQIVNQASVAFFLLGIIEQVSIHPQVKHHCETKKKKILSGTDYRSMGEGWFIPKESHYSAVFNGLNVMKWEGLHVLVYCLYLLSLPHPSSPTSMSGC